MRNWDESHDLDADLMRELLLGRLAVVPDPRGLRVRGVRIRRRVDLDLVHSPVLLAVHDSLLDEGASANDIANLGQLLKTMAPYAPRPPAGATPPQRWGDGSTSGSCWATGSPTSSSGVRRS